ncbi:alcohol dehydrogenase catalytic domain-containing protein [Streptomyces uncialis]|uniref:alcohol dehydrogenase catalytic domain-containing protein n=1 Tax=Streptomyces uncialis TaxID=1048205 RepID=UPI0022588898|nr:zinc-binding dehydrogenase [Streptomyces uncialis]MCX4661000.1 zinc-binding dehydrogenase [Streptomyces uncialis]
MRAVRLHAFGPAENLVVDEVPDPVPAPGEVLVRVAAAGAHLLDTALRQGLRGPLPEPPRLPTVPGREVAGTVTALGAGVPARWLGKRVVAHLGLVPGGYAEQAAVPAGRLHEIPGPLGFAQAVAMIGTGRTTLAVLGFAEPGPGDVVIVPGAAGGMGTLLVQYAKHAGATVVGIAGGPARTALVAAGAADLAVDRTRPDWPVEVRAFLDGRAEAAGTGAGPESGSGTGPGADTGPGSGAGPGPGSGAGPGAGPGSGSGAGPDARRGGGPEGGPGGGPGTGPDARLGSGPGIAGRRATIVFDGVGGGTARAAVDLLAPGGHHVVFGWFDEGDDLHGGEALTFPASYLTERGIRSEVVLGPRILSRVGGPDPMRTLESRSLRLAAEGRLVPAVQRFPLADAVGAHRAMEARTTVGKVVLEP